MTTKWIAAIVAALTVSSLAVAGVPSVAVEPMVTVTDRAGAAGDVLSQLERLAGRPLGDPQAAVAVETGGRPLSTAQIDALLAGEPVEGARVLGAISGTREVLSTTIADLSDGRFDGPRGTATPTSTVLFAAAAPGGREWCLTMCMASGKTFYQCFLERIGRIDWLSLDLSGGTSLGATRTAFSQSGVVSFGELRSAETLIGEGEPPAEDIEALLEGREADSLRRVAKVDGPDADWALGDLAEKSGVVYAKTKAHIFTFELPWLGKILAVCISQDGGKTWKCSWKQWNGF